MILNELLTSDAGLMSLGVIVLTLAIGGFMWWRFRAFIRDEQSARDRN